MMWIPTGLWSDHWNTLRSQKTGKPMQWDRITLILLPLAAAIISAIWPPGQTSVLIDGTAILTGLLFGLLIHVFSLGVSAGADERLQGTWIIGLIDELRINTSYAVAVGIAGVTFLAIDGAYPRAPGWLSRPFGAIGVLLVVHLLMTLGMVIKRTNRAYVEMRRTADAYAKTHHYV